MWCLQKGRQRRRNLKKYNKIQTKQLEQQQWQQRQQHKNFIYHWLAVKCVLWSYQTDEKYKEIRKNKTK